MVCPQGACCLLLLGSAFGKSFANICSLQHTWFWFQGPVVFGGKVEERCKPTDKIKVVVASATVMNKTDGKGSGKEQAWNHSVETRIKAGEDDKLLVSPLRTVYVAVPPLTSLLTHLFTAAFV